MTSTGAAHVELAGRTSRVGTGVAVLDHLLEELAEAGAFGLTLEIAPDAPEIWPLGMLRSELRELSDASSEFV